MATKLIQLEDGTLIEVEMPGDQVEQISGGFADKVSATFDKIEPILVNTCRPIVAAWKTLDQEMYIEEAEVEVGLSFEGEGNIYITRTTAGANLTVTLKLKPKEEPNSS